MLYIDKLLKDYNITQDVINNFSVTMKYMLNKIRSEEDEYEFTYKGYICEIKRHNRRLVLNGYVTCSDKHRLFTDEDENEKCYDVHGGITYEHTDVENATYTLGFDTNHYNDLSFYFSNNKCEIFPFDNGTYKDVQYVTSEIKKLVNQIDYPEYQAYIRKSKIESIIKNN